MKIPSKSLKNNIEKVTKLASKESMIKVQFKKPFNRRILKKEAKDQNITFHQDLNLETRVKRSILWKIGDYMKSKTKNGFSISKDSELCLLGKDGQKKFLKYHECISKFGNQLTPEDIESAYCKIKDPLRMNTSAILLL